MNSRVEAGDYIFLEEYISQADVDHHMQTPYFQEAVARLGEIAAAKPTLEILEVIIYAD